MNRNLILISAVGAVAVAAAFALSLSSSGDEGVPAGLSEDGSPVVTVYKSPT